MEAQPALVGIEGDAGPGGAFFRDQHRFSDWVYVAASANMAFWVLSGWAFFSLRHTYASLAVVLAFAFLASFSPVLLRTFRPGQRSAS